MYELYSTQFVTFKYEVELLEYIIYFFMNVKTKSTLTARENFGIGQQINVLIARENNGIETINI